VAESSPPECEGSSRSFPQAKTFASYSATVLLLFNPLSELTLYLASSGPLNGTVSTFQMRRQK